MKSNNNSGEALGVLGFGVLMNGPSNSAVLACRGDSSAYCTFIKSASALGALLYICIAFLALYALYVFMTNGGLKRISNYVANKKSKRK